MWFPTGWTRGASLLSFWLLGLAACAQEGPYGNLNHPAQQALIGKTKQELLACAGKPVGEFTDGDRIVVVYYKEASVLEESFPSSKSSFPMVHHGCRATISLEQDRVDEVRYESIPRSYRDEDHCEELFSSCIAP